MTLHTENKNDGVGDSVGGGVDGVVAVDGVVGVDGVVAVDGRLDEDLDVSWIHDSEKLQSLIDNPHKEYASSISTCCLYVTSDNCVDSFVEDSYTFVKDSSHDFVNTSSDLSCNMISHADLLALSQKYKKKTSKSHFVLKSIVLFHLDFDSEQVLAFSQCDDLEALKAQTANCIHTYHTIGNIIIPPSLCVFHPWNTLYFFFHEEPSVESKMELKSILKLDKSKPYSERHKFTKRVRIQVPRSTRKRREDG
jgi:hypothetical protein